MIGWHEELSVGVPLFDRQHKCLIDLLNRLQDSIRSNQSQTNTILHELLDGTQAHFAAEEKAFLTYHFPLADQHKEEHTNLIEQAVELAMRIREEGEALGTDALEFLTDWVVNHIMNSDMRYKAFFQDKHLGP